MDEDDDDGDTALVGSLASRTGRGLGGDAACWDSLGVVFLLSHVSAFRRSFFLCVCFLRPHAGSASEAPERIGICSMDERGIQSSNSL